jgi:hypothetical protein
MKIRHNVALSLSPAPPFLICCFSKIQLQNRHMSSICYATTIEDDVLEDRIWHLEGIWKYAALDYHIRAKGLVANRTRKANEYAITLMKLWDTLDGLPLTDIESVLVELEGKIVAFRKSDSKGEKKHQADMKALRTQLEQYLQVRREVDEVRQKQNENQT